MYYDGHIVENNKLNYASTYKYDERYVSKFRADACFDKIDTI